MAGCEEVDSKGEIVKENDNTQITGENISSLKSAFIPEHFAEAEERLVSMVQKLELKIKERALIEERAQIWRLEKLKAESELKDCKRECLQLKKERDGFNDLAKNISEDKRVIRELQKENRDLKNATSKAETELDLYKRKFEELQAMVLLLREDLVLLKSKKPIKTGRVSGGFVGEKGVADRNAKNVKTDAVGFDPNKNFVMEASGGPCGWSPESRNSNVRSPGLGHPGLAVDCSGKEAVSENEKGSQGDGSVKAEMGAVGGNEKMVLGANPGFSSNSKGNEDSNMGASGGETCRRNKIAGIADSDHDSSPCENLSEKKLAMKGYQDEAVLGQEVVKIETRSLKRKRASCSPSKDGCGASNEQEVPECQMFIQGPYSLPVNHCSGETKSPGARSNEGGNVSNPSKRISMTLRQLKEKVRAELCSRDQRNETVLDRLPHDCSSEESSSSSDSEDFDLSFDFSAMIKQEQARRGRS